IGRRGNDPHRFLSVFFQTAQGFKPKPDQTVEVPPSACCRFVADLDPASPGLEIGFIGTHGAFCFTAKGRVFDASRPKRLFDEESFFDIAPGTQLPDWDPLVKDVDGDGRADILFPRKGSFALWKQGADGAFARAADLPVEYNQHFGTAIETLLLNRFINYRAGLSRPAYADIDGSRKLDLVTYRDGRLDVFLQKPGAAAVFGRDPDRTMSIENLTEKDASGGGDDSYNSVNAEFADVDGDGHADVVLYRNVGKVGLFESMRTQVLFYRARPKTGWNAQKPDQVVNLKGLSINPALIDVDKDGAKDLVVSSLRTDLVTNAKRALFSNVTITYYVFRYDKKGGKFHEVPDYSRDLSIDVSRIEGGGTIPVANFSGDYDGDGYPDLLSLEKTDEVRILPGKIESGFFSGEKLDYDEGDETAVQIETSNSVVIDDLNHDGKSDFLFWYFDPNWESKERGTVKVAVSR
ncbi:MAG TPA: VCBS repeat-containing protein, partial [Planctomycetota bacterium]|nr:VCBS repeat-containing protein [Planctomycetota bacterium]